MQLNKGLLVLAFLNGSRVVVFRPISIPTHSYNRILSTLHVILLLYLLLKLKLCTVTPGKPDPETRSAVWLHTSDEWDKRFYFEGSRLKVKLDLCHLLSPKNIFDIIAYTLLPVLSLTKNVNKKHIHTDTHGQCHPIKEYTVTPNIRTTIHHKY